MIKAAKKLYVQITRLGDIDVAHRLAIVPGSEINHYYEPRLRNRSTVDTAGFSLVLLERDLSGDGREYVAMEWLQSRSQAALLQAMQEGLVVQDAPVVYRAAENGLLRIMAQPAADKKPGHLPASAVAARA